MKSLSNDIVQKLNTGRKTLIPIDKESMTIKDKNVDAGDFAKGFNKDIHKSNIAKIQYMPKFGGIVVTNQNGDMYKLGEIMDNETSSIISSESPLVNKYLSIAMDPNQPYEIRQQAMEGVNHISQRLVEPVATKLSGFYNHPMATETSKKPSQIIFQGN